jgi:phosphatidyl-myo-inositol dimannoside synthase
VHNKVLFLTLRTFSAVGGIEKVCKVFGKGLVDLQQQLAIKQLLVMAMYDHNGDIESKYIPEHAFIGAKKNKIKFIANAIQQGINSKVVIISHINLLLVGYLIKILSPKTKLILLAHGIEIWNEPNFLRKKMFNKCNEIWCVSAFTKEKIQQFLKATNIKLQILNNCLDPFLPPSYSVKEAQLLNRYNLSKSDVILLTLTRLSSSELYKGYDHVLAVFNNLVQRFPTLKYLIVGKYDAVERKRLQDLIVQYGLEKRVVFSGYITDEEIANHYGLADAYIMPSKKEGFGIVFLEAMYYGLPVIAGNIDGSSDALLQGKLGTLVNPDSEKEIEQAIVTILENKNATRPNKDLLMQHFSFEVYKKNVAQLLAPHLLN